VTDAGVILRPLQATRRQNGKLGLTGNFGVFFSGQIVAHFYNEHGAELGTMRLADADPSALVSLETEVGAPGTPARISIHLEDRNGIDRGSLQEVPVGVSEKR
jgi:hypothetical protein